MGFCEALGKKAHSQVCVFGRNTGFRQTVGLVKKSNSKPVTHTNAADTTSQNFGSTCMLLFGAKASQAKSSINLANFVLEAKKLLHEALGTKNSSSVLVNHYILQFYPSIEKQAKICLRKKCANYHSLGHFNHSPVIG